MTHSDPWCVVRRAVVLALLCVTLLTTGAHAAATPTRIVSIVPAVTEMLFAIGAGPQIVGVSSFDHFPAAVESIPRVGGLLDPDVERILKLSPDLVIVYGRHSDLAARLSRANIATYVYETGDLNNVTRTIRALGERVGRTKDAEAEATRIERGLDALRARVAGQPRYRTLLIFGREPRTLRSVYASGGLGFLHDLLEIAGGDDIFGDVKRENLQISAEQMLARAPEAIVELHGTMSPQRIAAERAVWSQLPGIPAVRNGRVYLLASELLTIPGPRVVEAATLMAEALHPALKKH